MRVDAQRRTRICARDWGILSSGIQQASLDSPPCWQNPAGDRISGSRSDRLSSVSSMMVGWVVAEREHAQGWKRWREGDLLDGTDCPSVHTTRRCWGQAHRSALFVANQKPQLIRGAREGVTDHRAARHTAKVNGTNESAGSKSRSRRYPRIRLTGAQPDGLGPAQLLSSRTLPHGCVADELELHWGRTQEGRCCSTVW